jgi:hypothetical protein
LFVHRSHLVPFDKHLREEKLDISNELLIEKGLPSLSLSIQM